MAVLGLNTHDTGTLWTLTTVAMSPRWNETSTTGGTCRQRRWHVFIWETLTIGMTFQTCILFTNCIHNIFVSHKSVNVTCPCLKRTWENAKKKQHKNQTSWQNHVKRDTMKCLNKQFALSDNDRRHNVGKRYLKALFGRLSWERTLHIVHHLTD